jgi:hypothetical protein
MNATANGPFPANDGPPACPVCDGVRTVPFVRRERVPVHQNLLYESPTAARKARRGTLALHACSDCDFVFNAAFDDSLMSYGEHYENAQEHSTVFERHVDSLARLLVESRGLRNSHVVEVGCGQGSFLRRLVEYPGAGNSGTGFDPSYAGPLETHNGRLRFRREFYGASSSELHADAVVSRHVIEHVQRPIEMLRSVRAAMDGALHAPVFFETPCIEWILRERATWDLFYEHCSLFSPRSITHAFARAGFAVREVSHVFGGQYLWLEAVAMGGVATALPPPALTAAEGSLVARAIAFGEDETARCAAIAARLRGLGADGPVALWGAGAKGCTLAALVDPDATLIDSLIDINPGKQGHFVAGTGHPILSPTQAADRGVRHAILMNPNYRNECGAMLHRDRITIRLLEID